jgi:SAM-dependent methyltransferase
MSFNNAYEDKIRAESYSRLEFPNTYYLAYRDLPDIIARFVTGRGAVDFGCGTGRSSRFIQQMGFKVTGIDIAENMIQKARELDPDGDYRHVEEGDFGILPKNSFDLVLSVFTFDNIPSHANRIRLFTGFRDLLKGNGKVILLDSTPELYTHEWSSFSTHDFPENKSAISGGSVKVIMKDVKDTRPVEDIFWTDNDYRDAFKAAGMELICTHTPLGSISEPYQWISETTVAPWVIYVLKGSQ